jgi:hypothetical protein
MGARLTLSLLAFALLAGCTTTVYRPVPLPIPVRPVLMPVPAGALQCLAPDTYTTIVNRERGYKTWGLQLEAIIRANNAKAADATPAH